MGDAGRMTRVVVIAGAEVRLLLRFTPDYLGVRVRVVGTEHGQVSGSGRRSWGGIQVISYYGSNRVCYVALCGHVLLGMGLWERASLMG